MTDRRETRREPKASRVRVWQAVERIVESGRRPTVAGVRELLGGGSPNSVTGYLNEWYEELGERLARPPSHLNELPREAAMLLAELWRLATVGGNEPSRADADVAGKVREAERSALIAETKALTTLNKELQQQRAAAERNLAELRALLARREAALEEARTTTASLEQALASARLDLAIALERLRLAPDQPGARRRPRRTRRVSPKPGRSKATKKAQGKKPRRRRVRNRR